MILWNPHKSNYASLLRDLLIKPDICPGKKTLPQNKKEWLSFIDMSYSNRLVTLLYHFVDCKTCKSSVPRVIKGMIQQYYTEALIRYENYKKIRRKLKVFIKKTGIPLILIKDLDERIIKKYYPPHYVPLKFDIDILGRYKDLERFRKYTKSMGYEPINYGTNPPDSLDSQLKFYSIENKIFVPQIEYRFLAVTIPHDRKNLLDKFTIVKMTNAVWKEINISRTDFSRLTKEYELLLYLLNFYFGDGGKSLNSLNRIAIMILSNKDNLNWNKIKVQSKYHHVTNVVSFVLGLLNKIFPSFSQVNFPNRITVSLALSLIDINFICKVFLNNRRDNKLKESDDYILFLTGGFLNDDPFWRKIIIFLHPRRLFYLLHTQLKLQNH